MLWGYPSQAGNSHRVCGLPWEAESESRTSSRGPSRKYVHRHTGAPGRSGQEVDSVGGSNKGSFLGYWTYAPVFCVGLGNRNPVLIRQSTPSSNYNMQFLKSQGHKTPTGHMSRGRERNFVVGAWERTDQSDGAKSMLQT